ncbi:MAG: glycosyl transferase family 1 [Hyphomicrobiales bacterium]
MAHNLNDPAIRRRVLFMQAGGSNVAIAGFGDKEKISELDLNSEPIYLGKRADGRLVGRALSVAFAIPKLMRLTRNKPLPEVILARNIEMLFLASMTRRISKRKELPVVYECLDIHKLQLAKSWKGRVLRYIEGYLIKRSSAIVTSSPAFKSNYFDRFKNAPKDIVLIENKVLELSGLEHEKLPQQLLDTVPAWKIGWFGTLRCQKSMSALAKFVQQTKNQFKIVLRGRPALSAHDDFFAEVDANTKVDFLGKYRNPEDLEEIYSQVHFSWLVDFYEEGQNSNWLLPNRLYEGCRFGAVPIALAGTETARFLQELNIGIVLPNIRQETLARYLTNITVQQYMILRKQVLAIDVSRWSHCKEDGAAFVNFLSRLQMPKDAQRRSVEASNGREVRANSKCQM